MESHFTTEQQLVSMFETVAPIFRKGFQSLLELNGSNGIADLALFQLRKDWQKNAHLGAIPLAGHMHYINCLIAVILQLMISPVSR
jgi:hypothetical protein